MEKENVNSDFLHELSILAKKSKLPAVLVAQYEVDSRHFVSRRKKYYSCSKCFMPFGNRDDLEPRIEETCSVCFFKEPTRKVKKRKQKKPKTPKTPKISSVTKASTPVYIAKLQMESATQKKKNKRKIIESGQEPNFLQSLFGIGMKPS